MTSDERNMLADLANKIAQTPAPPRDPEAEDFIRSKIGSRPDALYLMTQTVLIQNLALQHAQEQIRELQKSGGAAQIPGPGGSSFLGQQTQQTPAPRMAGNTSAAQAPYAAPAPPTYAAPSPGGPGPSVGPSGAPSFLRGAAQTAAGVAAGALAFEGIRSLFSHPGYGGGSGFFGGGGIGGYGPPAEESVVNNYYDSPSGGQDYDRSSDTGNDDYQSTGTGGDQFDNSSDVDNSGDLGPADDGGFDDGGGFDDNSGGDNFA